MLNNTRIDGQLIFLRPAKVMDAEEMLAALQPEATRNFQFFTSEVPIYRQVQYLQRMYLSHSDQLFAICEVKTGRMVGTIGLHEIDTHLKLARLGLLIFRAEDRGKGFGNEATILLVNFAFKTLRLNKVYANLFAENERAQQHYRRIGFQTEGLLRQEYLLNGTYHDLVRMSVLWPEWAAAETSERS